MNLKALLLVFLFLPCAIRGFAAECPQKTAATTDSEVFALIRGRIVQDLAEVAGIENALEKSKVLLTSQRPDGSWSDIDYANRHRTVWLPGHHLTRLLTLAVAYGTPDSPRFRDPAFRDALLRGLRHWYTTHPTSDNWWYNHIYTPQRLGEILLLAQNAGDDLPPDLTAALLARWEKEGARPDVKAFNTTGSNRMNIAAHWCYRGLFTGNAKTLRIGVDGVFGPLALTTREGLQHDLSYHQHGPQLYLGNYGYDWLLLMSAWLHRFQGTPYAPAPQDAALAVRYALDAYLPAIRGQWYLFNAIGRQQASEPGRGNAEKNRPILRWLVHLAPEHRADFEAAIDRLEGRANASAPIPFSKVFWRSDYALHVRPAFTFDVRAASVRTNRCEWGNNENLLGYWLAEGATDFCRTGTEYADIAPLWDWHRVPGTTVVNAGDDRAIPRRGAWGVRGDSIFVGGVTDGESSVFSYRRDTPDRPATKAWFALGDTVVCLGTGLSSEGPHPLETTVNQCYRRGPVTPAAALAQGRLATPATLVHDGLRYTFPGKGEVRVSSETRTSNWKRVSSAHNVPVSGELFTLWFDHGPAAKEAAYAYIVSPAELPTSDTLRILSNTPALQAVADGENRLGIVFHEPGELLDVKAEAPCVVLRSPRGTFVADPTQKLKSLTLSVNGRSKNLTLPTGPAAGSPVDFL